MSNSSLDIDFEQPLRLFFLGIGGIGMSALARYLHAHAHSVSGYDKTLSPITQALEQEGVVVTNQAADFHAEAYDLIVYTPALNVTDPILKTAQQSATPLLKRSEVLGLLSRTYKTIAIAGTHGKTTTSAMLAWILKQSGVAASGLVGGILSNSGSNYIAGGNEWLVVEADEYDRSFLRLYPQLSLVTSLDVDHLDIYGSVAQMRQTYVEFMHNLQPGGTLLMTLQWQAFSPELSGRNCDSYGLSDATYYAENLRSEGFRSIFDFHAPGVSLENLRLNLPGRHNVENATGALALALLTGADPHELPTALASFKGIHRRFEQVYEDETLIVIDDYAHHPTELESAISAARELFPTRKLQVVFQPHLYSRTRDFYREFGAILSQADDITLIHIYPARELSIPHVTSDLVFQQIEHSQKRLISLEEMPTTCLDVLTDTPTVLLLLGAGDISTQIEPLKQHLEINRNNR